MNVITNKRLLIIVTILFIWFIIHTTFVVIDGLNDELKHVDAAVVLGNKVEVNGQPSIRLKARLDRSIELYKDGYYSFIIVSGGTGKEGFDEARVMKSYLVDKGIPEDNIIEDNNGYNSYMTAQNTSKIMDELKFESVMVISQYFHVSRTKLAFSKMDIKEVYSAHAKIFEIRDIYSIIREFSAYYNYLLK
ncbi:MAG: YdcF family protein [Candidatus Pristimantibacillus lignocellulolyticus]|uniref:YdcF family protein n=1 Tax=Candidatus Pristimantibacillus lignocellulolyticus TaxID=2994561 RepID=A0A9J6ZCW6_9BACL|nr:MAG: YdcF family protein [Candidatus Pristimantibacillus lignocellulolyticus]